MVHAKNYETVSTCVKVMQKKTVASFFWTRCMTVCHCHTRKLCQNH